VVKKIKTTGMGMKGRRQAGKERGHYTGRKTGRQQTGKDGETIDRENERNERGCDSRK
jgi:hypothetical protein